VEGPHRATFKEAPACRGPLLRVDVAPLNLVIYGSRFSVSAWCRIYCGVSVSIPCPNAPLAANSAASLNVPAEQVAQ
jgi:hypothetical protein